MAQVRYNKVMLGGPFTAVDPLLRGTEPVECDPRYLHPVSSTDPRSWQVRARGYREYDHHVRGAERAVRAYRADDRSRPRERRRDLLRLRRQPLLGVPAPQDREHAPRDGAVRLLQRGRHADPDRLR